MQYIRIGKIVNTHGIKGEIRILSNFDRKESVFISGFIIYIGKKKEKFLIKTYRTHKNFDMITLEGITDINEVLKYKGLDVYINREDMNLSQDEYLLDDLLNMNVVCDDKEYGIVEDIYDNNGNIILAIKFEKNYYIPYNSNYIKKVDLPKKKIIVENIEDLIL